MLSIRQPLLRQPKAALGRAGYGVSDVYLPPTGLVSVCSGDVAAMHATLGTYNATPVGLAYGHASGGLYTPSLTLPAAGTYASLLMVIGNMPTANNGSFFFGTSGFGLRANSGILTYRASSTSLMATSKAVGAGTVLFASWRSGDHRIEVAHADGSIEAQVNTASWGNASPVDALQEVGQSIALLARWINWVPPAEVRQRLLREPWSLLGDDEIWLWASSAPAADLAGTAAGAAAASGALSTGIPVLGAALGVASSGASLSTGIPMEGVAAAVSAGDGQLTTAVTLSGAALAQAVAAAAMSAGIILTADAVAVAAAQGTLATAIQLIGAATAQSAASGSLDAAASLYGSAQAQAAAAASLTVQIRLDGQALAQAAAAAGLETAIPLLGTAAGTTAAGGDLTTEGGALAGSAAAAAGAYGALTTAIPITGGALAAAIAAGSLTVQIRLDGAAGAAAGGQAQLATEILIAGQAAALATATASLTAPGSQLAAGPVWMISRVAPVADYLTDIAPVATYRAEVMRVQ